MNKNVRFFNIDGIQMIGNFNNGAVIGLDEDGYQYLKNDNLKTISSEKRKELDGALVELGFLKDEEEQRIDAAYVHVLDACNLHCVGCYSYVEDRNMIKKLSLENIKKIFDELAKVKVQKVVISGGEPFLRDDIAEICRYAKEECCIEFLTVITNGTMPLDRYYPALKYLNQLNISVDGYDEDSRFIRDEGIMPKVLNTVETLKSEIEINMIITLHKKNMKYMDKYNELSKRLGVRFSFSIFTVDESNPLFSEYVLTDTDLIEIENTLMKLNIDAAISDTPIGGEVLQCRSRCEAGHKLISVDARGDIYPCHMLHKDELKMGNAITESIKDIVFEKENPFMQVNVDEINTCSECNYKYLCGGGCRGRSYLKWGNINNKDSYCAMIFNYYKDIICGVKQNIGAAE